MNGKATPTKAKPLVKDTEVAHGDFSYSIAVGMMLYLSGHLRPDIAYAVNCAMCHVFCPRNSHELALKRLEDIERLHIQGDSF